MRVLITFLLMAGIYPAFCQNATRDKFSATEIRDDLSFLYKTLKEAHYNLYVKTNNKIFDREFKKLQHSIKDSMTILQSHRLFQPFLALSGLSHCNIAYPFSPSYINYVMNKGTLFPFDISIVDRSLFITANYSEDSSIHVNDQILSINNTHGGKYLENMYTYISGDNDYLKSTQIDLLFFSRVNWFVYDRSDIYELKIKDSTGMISDIKVKAIRAMDYEREAGKKISLVNSSREFKFIGDVAYLLPGVFLNTDGSTNISDHRSFEKGQFAFFIDSCFNVIRQSNTKNLVIDLRGNPGGDNSFSDEMISYFAREPFWFCSKFYVKTSAITKSFWENVKDTQVAVLRKLILENDNGKVFESPIIKCQPRPDSLQFKGNVYVLVNRYSYSNAVTSAALIQDYKFGIIIGEETADSPTTYAAIHQFNLPFTQLTVSYPKAFMIRPNGDRSLHGVIPDIPVKEILFNEMDEILDSTLKIINEHKQVP